MGLGYWEELSFGKIAERWSAELADKPNGFTHDEILHELVADLWRGQFEDDAGKTCLTLPTVYEEDKTFDRRDLLTAFRSGIYPPQSVARWELVRHKGPWDELAAVPLDEYNDRFREGYLEALQISYDDFRRWCEKHAGDVQPKFWKGSTPSSDTLQQEIIEVDRYRTGLPGRPTIKDKITSEFDRRADAGEVQSTLAGEAAALHEWVAKEHPKAPTATVGTIKNLIREAFSQHRSAKATK